MRRLFCGITFALLFFACDSVYHSKQQQMFADIDEAIAMVPVYDAEKEIKIENLKKKIHDSGSDDLKLELTDWLIAEYESYNSDSTLYYINLNLQNPKVVENPVLENRMLIKKADVAAHAGLFGEAAEILSHIDQSSLDSLLLESYYSAYCDLYQYQSEYATDSEYAQRHSRLREVYIDSIGMIASPESINFVVNQAASAVRNGDYRKAEEMLMKQLGKYNVGERNYSILASILADMYNQKGDRNNYTEYIGKSVISDIRGAVKENMAIRALATICYENGDLERADRYLRQSFADANFYSARMRNAQSSRMLPIIGEAYFSEQKKLNHSLTLLVIFISVLALGFILIALYAFKQVKKIRDINKKTKKMLDEVSSLSKKLSEVNSELSSANSELQNSNAIQREYGILFMEYCSLAISALQRYQQSLKVTAAQGNMEALKKKIDSANIENKTLSEFYAKFDEAILNLYPNFIEKFNSLLKPDERIEVKPKELLNTELRVFALIRIGITDSEKIAEFLRCSITTIYTYRSKIKKKAIDPDSFEQSLSHL